MFIKYLRIYQNREQNFLIKCKFLNKNFLKKLKPNRKHWNLKIAGLWDKNVPMQMKPNKLR